MRVELEGIPRREGAVVNADFWVPQQILEKFSRAARACRYTRFQIFAKSCESYPKTPRLAPGSDVT